MFIGLNYAARSDVGLVRQSNQDSAYAGSHLLVVADGMGGVAGGDIASSIAVAHLATLDNEAPGLDDALDQLKQTIADAHSEIVLRAENDPELSGLGTTVTCILRAGSAVALAHVGDSRAYLLREAEFKQVTTDHSFVQHLVDTGRITQEEAEHHPKRSMLMRVLGDVDADIPVDISVREIKVGDRWLLCSDGLSGVISSDTIEQTLAEVEDPGDCADALVSFALSAGAPDNVTCIVADVIDFDELEEEGPDYAPQIVGSAALDRHRPSLGGDSPAAKAARLSTKNKQVEEDSEPVAKERWIKFRPWLLPVIVLVGLIAMAYFGYSWIKNQYFVTTFGDKVAIYQGIPQQLGPISLNSLAWESDVSLDSLTSFEQQRVNDGIRTESFEDAKEIILELAE